MNEKNLEKCTE